MLKCQKAVCLLLVYVCVTECCHMCRSVGMPTCPHLSLKSGMVPAGLACSASPVLEVHFCIVPRLSTWVTGIKLKFFVVVKQAFYPLNLDSHLHESKVDLSIKVSTQLNLNNFISNQSYVYVSMHTEYRGHRGQGGYQLHETGVTATQGRCLELNSGLWKGKVGS